MKIANQDVRMLQVCIITSILSQIESISSLMRPIMYVAWIATTFIFLIRNQWKLPFHKCTAVFCGCYMLLIAGCITLALFGTQHLTGNYIHIMYIPLIVSILGEMFSPFARTEDYNCLLKMYVAGALVYAVWVNFTYFASYNSWLKQNVYTFLQKNSAAQIWSTGILILLILIEYQTVKQRVAGYLCAAYLLLLCGISQCRTAILALGIVLVCYIVSKSRHKIRWMGLVLVVALFLWNNSVTRRFIDQALLLTKYAGADMNTFSSGRLDGWDRAISSFVQSPFFGCGRYYVDCSYISILAELGIVGFFIVELIWIMRAVGNFKNSVSEKQKTFLFCLTIFYIIESLLEGYPPFGPGVSSFMFWFLSAAYDNEIHNRNELITGEAKE